MATPSTHFENALQIPSITIDDLKAFHRTTFPSLPLPTSYVGLEGSEVAKQDEDSYGLGHYPDGQVRSLTDEDIAYFRMLEIIKYQKRRQKQAQRPQKTSKAARRKRAKLKKQEAEREAYIKAQTANSEVCSLYEA
jgi:hypothetical protein